MPTRTVAPSGDGMRTALALFECGLEIQRQNLRREFPDAPESEIEDRVAEWLLVRRGAERGDAFGRTSHRVFTRS